jgi:hypothetical protein
MVLSRQKMPQRIRVVWSPGRKSGKSTCAEGCWKASIGFSRTRAQRCRLGCIMHSDKAQMAVLKIPPIIYCWARIAIYFSRDVSEVGVAVIRHQTPAQVRSYLRGPYSCHFRINQRNNIDVNLYVGPMGADQ